MNRNKKLAYAIKATRINLGLSGEYIGAMLGISKGAYSNLENGKTIISIDRVEKLATLLNTTIEALLQLNTKTEDDTEYISIIVGGVKSVYHRV
jgi:transcriptional regulator with XRE-family HTH domain